MQLIDELEPAWISGHSLAFGADGGLSGYTLLQVHYRL